MQLVCYYTAATNNRGKYPFDAKECKTIFISIKG